MVDVIECMDMMGQSKIDFLKKGIKIGNENAPRAMMWVQFPSPAELIRVAELLGVNAISKRRNDYVFALAGTIYYARG